MDAHWITTTILSAIDGFLDWNLLSGKIVLSPPFKKLMGYTKEELGGDNKHFFHENAHASDKDIIMQAFSSAFAGKRSRFAKEMRIKRKHGDYIWVRLQGKIFRNIEGKAERFSGIVLDIHDARQGMVPAGEQLGAAHSKSKVVTMLNHEMRSPLASIISTAHLMAEDELTPKQERHVQNIIHSADFLLKLVSDVLDASKLDAGKIKIEAIPFSVREMLDDVRFIMSPACQEKGLSFDIFVDESIPKITIGDRTRLQQILINFTSNAVKFTKKGGVQINTNYTAITTHTGKLYMEVIDTGIGIPSDRMHMLFKEFSQTDISTSRLYGGSGLGLSICKKLMELMGGHIAARSEEGVGSTFWFEVTVDVQKGPRKEQESSMTVINKDQLKSLRVLVAEDNAVNQEVMTGLLERLKHKVTLADNGQVAVELTQKETFDVILMDINMPLKDGVEACREIRMFNKDIPIIAITANGMESERKRCLEAGMNEFATKPVDRAKLEALLYPYQAQGKIVLDEHEVNQNTMPSEPLFDKGQLKQLVDDLGESRIKRLVDLYKQDAPGLIENLKNNTDMERSAHTLAGMSENLYFMAISKRARSILQMVREENADQHIRVLANELPNFYTLTTDQVHKMFIS